MAYTAKDTSQNLVDLLNQEGIECVFAIGHGTGSHLLSQLTVYHSQRLITCLAAGDSGAGQAVDVELINKTIANSLDHAAYCSIENSDSEVAVQDLDDHECTLRRTHCRLADVFVLASIIQYTCVCCGSEGMERALWSSRGSRNGKRQTHIQDEACGTVSRYASDSMP